MSVGPSLPENLRAAIHAVEVLPGVKVLSPWTWEASVDRWTILLRLTPQVVASRQIEASSIKVLSITNWYALVEKGYPRGTVEIRPAKDAGLHQTFPHQALNSIGKQEPPWRDGILCLTTDVHVLNRTGLDAEPFDTFHRLRWYVERALSWLTAAINGTLTTEGDPFEFPQLPFSESRLKHIAFQEDADSFLQWEKCQVWVGQVDLGCVSDNSNTLFVKSFRSLHGVLISTPIWGHALSQKKTYQMGAWIRLHKCPIIAPWQIPVSWGDLRQATADQQVDLDKLLRAAAGYLRDGKQHPLLVGFPVPGRVGAAVCQMQWLSLTLPVLSRGARTANGFRPNEQGYWHRDRTDLIADPRSLPWQTTENWSQHELTARGSLPAEISRLRVAVLGGGALGSPVAELLVRAGVNVVTVVDGDLFGAGNLVRHTLPVSDIRGFKAEALANRLNAVSAYADVRAISASFPSINEVAAENLQETDLILDCTGSDEVLYALAEYPWQTRKRFISFSLGLHARRLFCFTASAYQFPVAAFQRKIRPWLALQRDEFAGEELPREGVGCWHPVFPARIDDIWMFAGIAVKQIETIIVSGRSGPELTVY